MGSVVQNTNNEPCLALATIAHIQTYQIRVRSPFLLPSCDLMPSPCLRAENCISRCAARSCVRTCFCFFPCQTHKHISKTYISTSICIHGHQPLRSRSLMPLSSLTPSPGSAFDPPGPPCAWLEPDGLLLLLLAITYGFWAVPSPVTPKAPGIDDVGSPLADLAPAPEESFDAFSSTLVMPLRQCGQVSCSFSHAATHWWWNQCLHGSSDTSSPMLTSSMHMLQSARPSAPSMSSVILFLRS